MRVLYDTRTVHPLDRYDYARAGAAAELAPVVIRGRAPGDLLAVMSVAQVGDFAVETVTWGADSEIVAYRTERLIRACDPECYRIFLSINGGVRMEQAGNRISFRASDIALYDLSRPWQATHTTGPIPMQLVMLTFPRTSVPIARATVAPLIGSVMPRNLPGRSLIAQFLAGLSDPRTAAEQAALTEVLRECIAGLIRQRLGQPSGFTPHTRRLLHLAHVRGIVRRHLGNPALGPAQIAQAANISPRYLHKLFQGTQLTPMELLKQLRLEECRRSLEDPALAAMPVKDIISAHGYLRPDQFARDFKQLFGISATQVRRQARQPWREG
ncbi:AraC family transcriptional regulator [Rhizocola hellebori]|nr:AraC family transcriptional regulator [Rhizocola hellebori]